MVGWNVERGGRVECGCYVSDEAEAVALRWRVRRGWSQERVRREQSKFSTHECLDRFCFSRVAQPEEQRKRLQNHYLVSVTFAVTTVTYTSIPPPTTPLPSPYSALAPRLCFAATALRKGRDRGAAPFPPTPRPRPVLTKVPLSPCSPTPSSKDRGHPCVKGAIDVTPHCLHSGRPVGQAAVRAGAAAAPALETHINTFSRGVVGDGVRRLAPVGSIGGRRWFHRNRRRWRCRRRRWR